MVSPSRAGIGSSEPCYRSGGPRFVPAGGGGSVFPASLEALRQAAPQYFQVDQGEFVPTTAPGIAVVKLITSVLSVSGATRTPGRAPPGGLVRTLRGKGRGKGK